MLWSFIYLLLLNLCMLDLVIFSFGISIRPHLLDCFLHVASLLKTDLYIHGIIYCTYISIV